MIILDIVNNQFSKSENLRKKKLSTSERRVMDDNVIESGYIESVFHHLQFFFENNFRAILKSILI